MARKWASSTVAVGDKIKPWASHGVMGRCSVELLKRLLSWFYFLTETTALKVSRVFSYQIRSDQVNVCTPAPYPPMAALL